MENLLEMHDPALPKVVMPSCPIRKSLVGQKALVTGASSGIGRAIAVASGHAGAQVVVNYSSSEEEAKEVVREIMRCEIGRASCRERV